MFLANRKLLAILSTAFLLYGVVLALGSRAGFPRRMRNGISFPYLCDKPVGEDGYYMLNVAWNLARGDGMVYNYHQRTVGVQPLSTFLYAALAWTTRRLGGGQWEFVRVVMLFGVLDQLLLACLIAQLAASLSCGEETSAAAAASLGFLLSLFSITLFRWSTYGLETGPYLTLFAICVLYSLHLSRSPDLNLQESLAFGALAGITGLARIDFSVILLFFLASALWQKRLKLAWTLVAGITAAALVAPWMAYVHSVTGSWIPSSGRAEAMLVTPASAIPRALAVVQAAMGYLAPWIYPISFWVALAGLLILLALLFLLMPWKRTAQLIQSTFGENSFLTYWLLSVAVLLLIYFAYFWDIHFYGRYAAPMLVITFPLLAVLGAEGIRKSKRFTQGAALLAMPACFAVWSFLCFHVGRVGNALTLEAGFVREHFSGTRVGAFQSGVVGYFNPNVINLDGKVNFTALIRAKEHRLESYIDDQGIQVIVDRQDYISHDLDQTWLHTRWKPCEEGNPPNDLGVDITLCFKRVDNPKLIY